MLSAYHYLPFPIFNVSAGSDEMIFLRLFKEKDTAHAFQWTVGIPKETGRRDTGMHSPAIRHCRRMRRRTDFSLL
jgi:hypothetical protein